MLERLSNTKCKKSLREAHGLSPVVANIILLTAVIAAGFAALGIVRSNSNIFAQQYGQTVAYDISILNEKVAFEYVFYNATSTRLHLYILNFGMANNISASVINLGNSSWSTTFSGTQVLLKYLNGTAVPALNIGEEGYILLPPTTLVRGTAYIVTINTQRGSAFACNFVP